MRGGSAKAWHGDDMVRMVIGRWSNVGRGTRFALDSAWPDSKSTVHDWHGLAMDASGLRWMALALVVAG